MFSQLRPAIMVLVLLTLVTGVAYPLLVTGIAQAIFPFQAQGSLVVKDGKVVGLGAHRPALRRPQVLLEPSVGHQPLRRQCGRLVRLQPEPDES